MKIINLNLFKSIFSASLVLTASQFIQGLLLAYVTSKFLNELSYSEYVKSELVVKYASIFGMCFVVTMGRLKMGLAKELLIFQLIVSLIIFFFVLLTATSFLAFIAFFAALNIEWLFFRYGKIAHLASISLIGRIGLIVLVSFGVFEEKLHYILVALILPNLFNLIYFKSIFHHLNIPSKFKAYSILSKLTPYALFYMLSGFIPFIDLGIVAFFRDNAEFASFAFNTKLYRILMVFGVFVATSTYQFHTISFLKGMLLAIILGIIALLGLYFFRGAIVEFVGKPSYGLGPVANMIFILGGFFGIINSYIYGSRFIICLTKGQMLLSVGLSCIAISAVSLVSVFLLGNEYLAFGFLIGQMALTIYFFSKWQRE